MMMFLSSSLPAQPASDPAPDTPPVEPGPVIPDAPWSPDAPLSPSTIITVTRTDDLLVNSATGQLIDPNSGQNLPATEISLRSALLLANLWQAQNGVVSGATTTINFDPDVFTGGNANTIQLNGAPLPLIFSNVNIDASALGDPLVLKGVMGNRDGLFLSGLPNPDANPFNANGPGQVINVSITNVDFQNMQAKGGSSTYGGGGMGAGGAIFANENVNLTLTDVSFTGNTAKGGSGNVTSSGLGGGGMYGDSNFSNSFGGGGLGSGNNASGGAGIGTGGSGYTGGSWGDNGLGQVLDGQFPTTNVAGGNQGNNGGIGGGGGGSSGGSGGFGGGGLGAGGAVFLREGATLTVNSTLNVNGNTVTAGIGNQSGSNFGSGFFLQGNGILTFAPGDGKTQTINNVIADQTGNGGTGGNAGSWDINFGGTGDAAGGTIILNAANTYSGNSTIQSGTLQISADNNLGTGGVTLNGGALKAGGTFTSSKNITVGSSGGTITAPDNAAQTFTLNGVISNVLNQVGALIFNGVGKTILGGTDANTYSGGSTISGATVELTNAGGLGSGDVANGGTINLNFASAMDFTNSVSGDGKLVVGGTQETTLSGASTFNGGSTINSGATAKLTNAGGLGIGDVTNNGTLNLNFAGTFLNVVSGSGSLVVSMAGTTILSGASSFTGGSTINIGATAKLTNVGGLGSGDVTNNGTIYLNLTTAAGDFTNNVSGDGSLVVGGSQVTTLSGTSTFTGGSTISNGATAKLMNEKGLGSTDAANASANKITLDGGTLEVAVDGTLGQNISVAADSAIRADQDKTLTLNGVLSGGSALTFNGLGTTVLGGDNSFSGGSTIDGATVELTSATGLGTGDVTNNGTINLNFEGTFANVVTGGATTVLAGGGVTLEGDTDTSWVISGGTSGQSPLAAASLTNTADMTIGSGGTLENNGMLTNQGTIIFSSTAATPYSGDDGTLALDGGTLQATVDTTLPWAMSVDTGGGTITADAGKTFTLNGVLSGSSALTFNGVGTTVLGAANTGFTGTSTISGGGTVKLTNAGGLGTGNITINTDPTTLIVGNLNLNFDGSFANAITGGHTTIMAGSNVTLTGANSTAWTVESGASATIYAIENWGDLATNLLGSLNILPSAGDFTFENPLTGSGTLKAIMNAAVDVFEFGAAVGDEFTGKVQLGEGSFTLDGDNTTALTSATLQIDTDNVTTVVDPTSTQNIGNLILNRGTLSFPTINLGAQSQSYQVATSSFDFSAGGTIQVGLQDAYTPPPGWNPDQDPDEPLVMQDEANVSYLIKTDPNSVIGDVSTLILKDANGNIIDPTQGYPTDIIQNGQAVATGYYNYGLSIDGDGQDIDGLVLSYGLTYLEMFQDANMVLSGDDPSVPGSSDMTSQLTGDGGVEIRANNSITLTNTNNDYIGPTLVTSGKLITGDSQALGHTSALSINSNASADLNGTIQTVGTLTTHGPLDLDDGDLTVSNGGSVDPNTLTGSGILDLSDGTLNVTGANSGLAAQVKIDSPAIIELTNVNGLGSSSIETDGTLSLTGASGTFTNPLSGNGDLFVKTGSNITLSGSNTHSGTTDVENSTVAISSNNNLGARTAPLSLDTSTLQFNAPVNLGNRPIHISGNPVLNTNGSDVSIGGTINHKTPNPLLRTAPDVLIKEGVGRLTITGNQPFSDLVQVNDGELKLNGTLAGEVTVEPGALFSGNNTIGGLINMGTVAPGNYIGTVTTTNGFNNTGGIYECEVNDQGQSDLINVTGRATTLGGTLNVIPMAGNYPIGQIFRYTILNSVAPITSTFNAVTGSILFKYTPIYQANQVLLEIIRNVGFGDITQGNASRIGTAIDNALSTATGTISDAIAALDNLPESQLSGALNQMGTASNVTLQTAFANDFFETTNTLDGRIHDAILESEDSPRKPNNSFASTPVAYLPDETWKSFFSQKSGNRTNNLPSANFQPAPTFNRRKGQDSSFWMSSDGISLTQKAVNQPGTYLPKVNTSRGAIQMGLDHQITKKGLLGLTVGYDYTSYHLGEQYGKGHVNGYQGGLYGSYRFTPSWYVNGIVIYHYGRAEGERNINFPGFSATANNKHNTHQVGGVISTGYDFKMPHKFTFTPMMSFGMLSAYEEGYTETGAGTVGLTVKGKSRNYLQSKFGGQLSKGFDIRDAKLNAYVKMAYTRRQGLSGANSVTSNFIDQGDSFTVFGGGTTKNLASPGVGLTASFKNGMFINVGYNADLNQSQSAHQGFLSIGQKF